MKILNLRFKNLNSLSGEWSIDFTFPEYSSNGIFAITGPTGAGKSTILDAICLALYGRTPRLDKVNKSSNEIMSRQTGECFAEVTFETMAGRYTCNWSQHRARKNAEGLLADAKHEIADAVSGKVLENKKRDVANAIEEKTGMDFDRFTRSMLLAQGGFAAFLQAAPNERAPILEQITGTEIYSEISRQVHERHREEHGKLELLQVATSGITLLSDDEEADLKKEISEKLKTEKQINTRNETLVNSINWLTGIDSLKNELASIEKEEIQSSEQLKSFESKRQKLKKALKAADLESEYATLKSNRQEQKTDIETLAQSEKKLPELEENFKKKAKDLKQAEETVLKVKNNQKSELDLIKKVRAIDLTVKEKTAGVTSASSELRAIKKEHEKNLTLFKKANDSKVQALNARKDLDKYIAANPEDSKLASELTGIREQLNNLRTSQTTITELQQKISNIKTQLEKDAAELTDKKALHKILQGKFDIAQKQALAAKEQFDQLLNGRLLREYREEKENKLRELAYINKIANLEEERKNLEDNTPCPLCGSKHHPYAVGNVPGAGETENRIQALTKLIEQLEKIEIQLKECEDSARSNKESCSNVEKQCELMSRQHKVFLDSLANQEAEQKKALAKFAELKEHIVAIVKPFGIDEQAINEPDRVLQKLNDKLTAWNQYQQRRLEIEKNISESESEIKKSEALAKVSEVNCKKAEENLKKLQKEMKVQTDERSRLYQDKNPDTEEERLEKQFTDTEKSAKLARDQHDLLKQQLSTLKAGIDTLKKDIAKRKPELEKLDAAFLVSCKKADFENEEAFLSCLLKRDERNQLQEQAKELDAKNADISTRKKDRSTKLKLEIEKKITDESIDVLKESQTETFSALKTLGEEIGAIKQKLANNSEAKNTLKEQQALIDAHKKECVRWDALHALIGSADGKKFRNFAQGITFELMVSHANKQLKKMTDRYLLIRDRQQPLELNVIDNYQAGENRSTKNLSGGESFIVSLALALGLSKMSSRKVRVDSLFLDEGFGSLDEDALETALETLSNLQQNGKLIGIISHVGALKERISTQINVTPITGGKSKISGPGCKTI